MQEQRDREDDPAVIAFTQLEGEIALMRRAIEQWAAEKTDIDSPDYSSTLGEMAKRLAAIEDKPAMTITPEDMASRIAAAAANARREDRTVLAEARKQHDEAAYGLERLLGTATTIADQRRHLLLAMGSGLLAGMLLWSIMPGVILRALPASWHMPESMAAHIIGEPSLWEAGSRLMQAGNPHGWQAIVDAAELRRSNRDAINACLQRAARTKAPVRCTVKVRAGGE